MTHLHVVRTLVLFTLFLVNNEGRHVSNNAAHLSHKQLLQEGRIVNGKVAIKGSLKWQVAFEHKNQRNRGAFCGGSLIQDSSSSNLYIATAAHCMHDAKPSQIIVITGETDLTENFEMHQVDKIIVHSHYDPKTFENDIALVKLQSSAENGAPITLETRKSLNETNCHVSGWGLRKENGQPSKVLRIGDVTIRTDAECQAAFKNHRVALFESNVCAGGGSTDSCQGDSGGPLFCCKNKGVDSSCTLVGIVSWGIGCARKGLPGVYTEVAYHFDWINEAIKKL